MLFSIILFSSLALSFILKGSYENIFIVLATIAFYKQVIVNKNYNLWSIDFVYWDKLGYIFYI